MSNRDDETSEQTTERGRVAAPIDTSREGSWGFAVLIAVTMLPVLGAVLLLIFDEFDFRAPSTWLVVGLFVFAMLSDEVRDRSYGPALERRLSNAPRFWRFFVEEMDKSVLFVLFITVFLTFAPSTVTEEHDNLPILFAKVVGLFIAINLMWASGREWLARRRER